MKKVAVPSGRIGTLISMPAVYVGAQNQNMVEAVTAAWFGRRAVPQSAAVCSPQNTLDNKSVGPSLAKNLVSLESSSQQQAHILQRAADYSGERIDCGGLDDSAHDSGPNGGGALGIRWCDSLDTPPALRA